jgi:uncharacterized protein (DUF849 family)
MDPIIITAAVTGAATVPTLSEYFPHKPQEIADSAVEAAEAGAAIVHVHARNPEDGAPSAQADHFREILTSIKSRCNAIINITTGGSPLMSVQERAANVGVFEPEMCSFNLGSMNFALHPPLKRIKEWRYEWEPVYLENSKDFVFKNTFYDLEHLCALVRKHNVKPEGEIYDVGHLYNLAFMIKEGFVDTPVHLQFVMGVLGGIGVMQEDLGFMQRKADTLIGPDNYTWSVCGVGRGQFGLAPMAMAMGGHVRVGLEDNLYLSKGVLAKSNAELVEKAVRLSGEMDRRVVSPDEARKILGTKGVEKVNF